MTKKDYELIAAALRGARNGYADNWDPNLFRACDDCARSVASALARDNPRFDRTRFLVAADARP